MSNSKLSAAYAPLILVVDDDISIRLLMRASLERAGFRIAESDNGHDAIARFDRIKPDAILLDVMMPQMDGFETCKRIRKLPQGKHIPILMVTGMEDIDSIHRSFDSGATDFITKPINWTILNYRVKYMLRASEAFNDVIVKQEQIEKLAFFDHLTGLANRTMFKDTLDNALAENRCEETQLAVLFMDLDRFKTINDTLGHHAGDLLLKSVADRINSSIRETDLFSRMEQNHANRYVSRLGGDEFTLMLPHLKEPEDAGRVARRINEILTEPFQIEGNEVYISSSIGISIFPLDGTDSETLMKHADLAMYYAKENGRNNFQYYKKSLNIKACERLSFENDVRKAVAEGDFTLFYQPQINLQTGHIVGAECLTRWIHERLGDISPAEFIPVIEELGLIVPFTDWVIRQSGKQLAAWQAMDLEPFKIALNISSKSFIQQRLPEKIQKTMQENQIPAHYYEIELTESVIADQTRETLTILDQLRDLGLSIAVDDFGTAYSSLAYLKTFPVDIVKIDRYFIQDINTSKRDTTIVRAIIAMAHSMDMKVIAEGIETKEQIDVLREMGCDYGQGFLLSPAVPVNEFSYMMRSKVLLAS